MRRNRWCSFLFAISLAACTLPVGPDAPTDRLSIFERIWRDVDLHYSLFAIKRVDWDDVRVTFRRRILEADSNERFAEQIAAMLEMLEDPHVLLHTNERTFITREFPHTVFDPDVIRARYLGRPTRASEGVLTAGLVAPTVGYVWLSTFDGTWTPGDFDAALASMPEATSLVIDLRENTGGSGAIARAIAGRFAGRAATYAYVRYRNGPAHDDFTDWIPRVVEPRGQRFSGRTVLITNRRTMSAAEDFVLAMKVATRAITIGDTTAGAAASPLVRELPNGWTYQFPEWIASTADGRVFEGKGLPPDEPLPMPRYIADNDPSLDRAIFAALNGR